MTSDKAPEKKQDSWRNRISSWKNLQYFASAAVLAYVSYRYLGPITESLAHTAEHDTGPYTALKDWWFGTSEGTSSYAIHNSFVTAAREAGIYYPTMGSVPAEALSENGFEKVESDGSITRYELVRGADGTVTGFKVVPGGERGTGPWLDNRDGGHTWHSDRDFRPNGEVSEGAYERSTAERLKNGDHPYHPVSNTKIDPEASAKVTADVSAKVKHINGPLHPVWHPDHNLTTMFEDPNTTQVAVVEAKGGFTDPNGRQWELWQKKDGTTYFRALYSGAARDYPAVDTQGNWSNLK